MLDAKQKFILDALAANDFVLTVHAIDRMTERNIRRADIVECGRTAETCYPQTKTGTHKVIGLDLDGNTLTVIVGIDRGTIVVTVY